MRIFNADAPFNNAIHAEDIAGFAAQYLGTASNVGGEIPIGSAGSVTVRGVVETLAAELGLVPRIEVAPDIRHSFTIDISAAAALGFAPMDTKDALVRYAREEARP